MELIIGRLLIAVSVFLLFAQPAQAYPDFIGYGYTTCGACHANPYGNGPLTDYGRALFSQEIAARTWISKSVTDEQLAELSGFLPGVQLPFWIRPQISYRGLYLDTGVGNASLEQKRWIHMQRDASFVLAADRDNRTIVSITYGLLDAQRDYYGKGPTQYVTREHYILHRFSDELLVAAGLMDKVYGIRIDDHTAYSRSRIGFGQDDQVHGVLVQYAKENWDLAIHGFLGNLLKPDDVRQKGFTAMGEVEVAPKNRAGVSIANYVNAYTNFQRFAIHDRWGLPNQKGTSLLVELGLKNDVDALSGSEKLGNYMMLRTLVGLARGYNIMSQFDRYQDVFTSKSIDDYRWTLGFMTFPFQRIEADAYAVQSKSFSPYTAVEDQWTLEGQLHVVF